MVRYLLCSDWSKEHKGRALYIADVAKREVRQVKQFPLTLDSTLTLARELAAEGNVLLSFDLPLGLPDSFLSTISNLPGWEAACTFPAFLPIAAQAPSFFKSGTEASRWSLHQPFFKVPPGAGSKFAFEQTAARAGVQLRRRIDLKTGGNPMFITAGIPGSVGSAAIDLWLRLGQLLPTSQDFKLWPFDGTLPELFASASIVIAENYPRAAYAAALCDAVPANRSRMKVSKCSAGIRLQAIEHLQCRPWVRDNGVTLHDTGTALGNENDFDALVTAAGLLRLLLEEQPLSSASFEDSIAEGGILGTGSVNFDLPETKFAPDEGTYQSEPVTRRTFHFADTLASQGVPALLFPCPIPTCTNFFTGSPGGWDGHVGAFKMHPSWQSNISDHKERLRLFRTEYPEFFFQ